MNTLTALLPTTAQPADAKAKEAEREKNVKQAFQKFVAGSFYQQMFKSLRKMHGKPAYFHGGQAEEMFQSQMDMQVAENLAEKHGDSLAAPMYRAFAQKLKLKMQSKPTQQPADKPPIPPNVEGSRL